MRFSRITTIEQHRCNHHTGLRMVELHNVRTDLSNHAEKSWDELSADEQTWWNDVINAIHAADVRLASLDADIRKEVEEEILRRANEFGDLENDAALMNNIIEEVESEEVRNSASDP
jgi:hypothetical protein